MGQPFSQQQPQAQQKKSLCFIPHDPAFSNKKFTPSETPFEKLHGDRPCIRWTFAEGSGDVHYDVVRSILLSLDHCHSLTTGGLAGYDTWAVFGEGQQQSGFTRYCVASNVHIENLVDLHIAEKSIVGEPQNQVTLFYEKSPASDNRRKQLEEFIEYNFIRCSNDREEWTQTHEERWLISPEGQKNRQPSPRYIKRIFEYTRPQDKDYSLPLLVSEFIRLATMLGIVKLCYNHQNAAGIKIDWNDFMPEGKKLTSIPLTIKKVPVRDGFKQFWISHRRMITSYFRELQKSSPEHFNLTLNDNGDSMVSLSIYVF